MCAKKPRADHEPSWAEVTLGAALSLVLGVALGAALLVLRPAVVVKEMPKEADRAPGVIYYLEGSRNTARAKETAAKRNLFVQAKSVIFTEEEINSFLAPATPAAPAAPKPGEKAAPAPAPVAPAGGMVSVGAPNVRIRDNTVQLVAPLTISVFGLFEPTVTLLARGGFTKEDNVFRYNPDTLYLGSCPLLHLPFAADYVQKKVFTRIPVPADLASAWPKLADVKVDGNTLKLAMP